ncbi:hypothetical protein [Flavobacterium tructae]|uniref:Uncharacterized protein n=1 Tax=Flavobacterium tructae TaxID=1114873 RepID=A0A1S1J2F9_9FLAO|nr:hypothetical protein [Flavobacterium tructae]OHT43968.1 hypothetical protein BHE19_16665 [Flavobacterium tructae]OXB21518.1 hypothetical protein B0A71_03155 [Flavobacterium tructae]OXB25349.1 hypothetical protein B0A80_01570 [Flavobacterium tructae]
MENKNIWEKLGTIGTFLSTTVLTIFTAIVGYQTSVMSDKVATFEKRINENRMISELIEKFETSMKGTIKSDLALLTLERYLRNNTEGGVLAVQDREMLVGFAESLILNTKKNDINIKELSYKVPRDFLMKYDLKRWNDIVAKYGPIKTDYIGSKQNVSDSTITYQQPVYQVADTQKATLVTSILDKIVYIQYESDVEIKKVEKMQQIFKDNQWAAPGIDKVNGKFSNIIKYFHPEDERLAKEANKILEGKYKIVNSITPKYQKLVPKGQIEVWTSN